MEQFITLNEAKNRVNEIIENAYTNFIKKAHENPAFIKVCYNSITNLKKPEIKWRKFGFNIAGITFCESNIIEMNINYLYSPDYNKFIKYTSLHELAHSIAYQLFNNAKHNKIWKYIDSMLGDDSNRCHDYARPINAPKKLKYIYECPTCKTIFKLSERQYKRVFNGSYCCMKCKTNLIKATFLKKEYL